MILVGNVRVPQVGGKVEKTPGGARVVLTVQPTTPHRVTRDGNKLTVRFDAVALDTTPLTGFIPEFASAAKVDGPSLIIDLGPSAATFKVEDAPDGVTIDLLPPAPVAPPPPPPAPPAAAANRPPQAATPPQIEMVPAASGRSCIDPGHGGEDAGVKGTDDTREKDLTLQVARRLKAAIESRLGIRVLLTRDADEDLAVDRRTAFANNNKADLFLSLHANSSVRPAAQRRAGVLAGRGELSAAVRRVRQQAPHGADARRRHARHRSGAVGSRAAALRRAVRRVRPRTVVQQFGERSVPLHSRADGDRADARAGRRQHAGGPHRARFPLERRR